VHRFNARGVSTPAGTSEIRWPLLGAHPFSAFLARAAARDR